ncbi:hypothetical protein WJU23_10945 [Prosthecobacter sp. SYSU 5D2]|uniref:hypothetical protein n=1 Tax=Prosthecobacter sp. SYSU 5D2 TaxID=3134134 RepID=UPI0031FF1CF6
MTSTPLEHSDSIHQNASPGQNKVGSNGPNIRLTSEADEVRQSKPHMSSCHTATDQADPASFSPATLENITSTLRQRPGYLRAAQCHTKNEFNEFNENSPSPQEDFSFNSCFSSPAQQRPQLSPAALYGPAGEIIRRLAPGKISTPFFQ